MDAISRHEQLLRIFSLIDILFGARRPLTTADLKALLRDRGVIDEMSDKNIRRDVEFLGRFGYAVRQSRVRTDNGRTRLAWSLLPGRGMHELATPPVTLSEMLSLLAAREFLAPLAGTFYWRGIAQILAKVEAVATPELRDYVASQKDGLVVHPRPAEEKYASRMLSAVNRAIRGAQELEIGYLGVAEARPRRVVIQPEALVVYQGSIYVAAYKAPGGASGGAAESRKRPATAAGAKPRRPANADGIRFYKLDRVARARPTTRTFVRRQVSVADLLADSITIFRSADPPRKFRIRIDPERARWACEKPFHPRQQVRRQPDGGVILEIDRAWEDELIPQLLGLGEMAEVLEPADVRDRIADTARRMAARYAGRGSRPTGSVHAGG